MKNRNIGEAVHALGKLAEVRLPVSTGLQIRGMIRKLNELAEDIEAERLKLVNALCEKDAEGNPVITDVGNGMGSYQFGANLAEFNSFFNDLMNCEAVGLPTALAAHQLGDVSIEPFVLMKLGELLDD